MCCGVMLLLLIIYIFVYIQLKSHEGKSSSVTNIFHAADNNAVWNHCFFVHREILVSKGLTENLIGVL